MDPEYTDAYINRGNAYADQGDFAAAMADLNKAIGLNPEDAEVYTNRGVVYHKTGDFAAAIADYDTAIILDPEYVGACANRGEAWLHLKEWKKAKADLITAKDKGIDIIASFRKKYKSVEDFEAKHEVTLPRDIAALLNGNGI